MRSVRLLLLAPLVLALTACGSDARPEPALSPVRLTVDGPLDPATVDDGTVAVHGRVFPDDAQVLVDGDEAGVDGGAFSATVTLAPGVNVVDVVAGAPRRRAAMTALRVTRRVPVAVPDLRGKEPDAAVAALERLGLRAKVTRSGGLLDELLPGALGVCGTTPDPGEKLRVGSTVEVEVAKAC
jgi:PASTA domain/Glucodextranase, domain B